MEPRSVAHFDVIARLGEGGMGVVYRARDRVLAREVALKLIRPERAADTEARQRFLREARSAAVLSHPGIATVYEAGEAPAEGAEGMPPLYIAQELVEGDTLAQRIRRDRLEVDEVIRLAGLAAEALAEAHERGVVHRDIKPSNIMVTRSGRVKILDFGVAKQLIWAADLDAPDTDLATWSRTAAGLIVGTPAYMAPEQIAGEAVDARVDVYAMGCVLYELLAGHPPFAGASAAEVLRHRLTGSPRPVEEIRPDVPPAVAATVARAMDPDPSRRFANGGELARALRTGGVETVTTLRSPAVPRPGRGWKRRVVVWALLAAGLGAVAWLVLDRTAPPALAFQERDFVLVADVLNETGEPVFDVALKSALETDLRQSRYVNVLEAGRVEETLRMMRRPAGAALDENVARDVCIRTGAKALVVPGILRAGEAYQLRAALVEPRTSRVVDEARVTARGREEVLLSSIDDLTRQLRQRLGESLASIDRTDPPFAQYTTSSLEALDLAGRGQRAWGAADAAGAERAYREALEHDPQFAMARGSLGLLLIQFLGQPEEGREMLTRALEDAGDASQREHLHLRAAHRQFVTGDLEGALEDYRFIAELYPDYMVPYNNSGDILRQIGRFEDAAAMFERSHRIEPRSAVPLWNLWTLYIWHLKDVAASERTARDLVDMLPDNPNALSGLAWSLVAERRFAEAEDEVRAALALDPAHVYALPNLGHLLLRRGAADEAVDVYRDVVARSREASTQMSEPHGVLCLGLALEAAGKGDAARRVLLEGAETLRTRDRTEPLDAGDRGLRAAQLAAAGRGDEAWGLLRALAREESSVALHLGLARAWSVLGERERAILALEEAVAAGYEDVYFILIDPPLAAVRNAPAVERLIPSGAAPPS